MNRNSIDSLEQLDLASLTAADLEVHYFTGRTIDIGIGTGRDRRKLYRFGVQTDIGDIEISVWVKAAERIVEREGLKEELEHLRPFALYTSNAGRITMLHEYVRHLDMCLSALYRNPAWVHFVPYNRQYHPELLEGVPMAQIILKCCGEFCEIPRAQISVDLNVAPCPICGRWSSFRYAKPDEQNQAERLEESK